MATNIATIIVNALINNATSDAEETYNLLIIIERIAKLINPLIKTARDKCNKVFDCCFLANKNKMMNSIKTKGICRITDIDVPSKLSTPTISVIKALTEVSVIKWSIENFIIRVQSNLLFLSISLIIISTY